MWKGYFHSFETSIASRGQIENCVAATSRLEHLRNVLRRLAAAGVSYESVSKVRFAMKDMVKRMVAEEHLTSNIAEGLKTPRIARRSDRSRLRRVTLAEYFRAWSVLDERERLAFDLVTFCGLRESEVYGLKNGDLFQQEAIRVQRSWYKGEVNPTKTNETREVGIGSEIFRRLTAWIATLPDPSPEAWAFPSERIATPLLPDNVLRRCIYPCLEPLDSTGSTSPRPAAVAFHFASRKRYGPQDHRRSARARLGCSPVEVRRFVACD
jgi:site-specific recombinase XerC